MHVAAQMKKLWAQAMPAVVGWCNGSLRPFVLSNTKTTLSVALLAY